MHHEKLKIKPMIDETTVNGDKSGKSQIRYFAIR